MYFVEESQKDDKLSKCKINFGFSLIFEKRQQMKINNEVLKKYTGSVMFIHILCVFNMLIYSHFLLVDYKK